jgi:hypothetical protein
MENVLITIHGTQKKQQKIFRKKNARSRKTEITNQSHQLHLSLIYLHWQQIKSEISSDGVCGFFSLLNFLFILYNIYLFTFVFKIYLFILVPVMCSVIYFQKREMLFLKLNRGKLHDNKKKFECNFNWRSYLSTG